MMDKPHEGHRARLRAQLRSGGLDSFSDIQVLELLLTYAIPRQDTNPIAHRLLERFGTLAAVLDAPQEELARVDGIGERAALLLSLVPQLIRRYELSRGEKEQILDSTGRIGEYLAPYFIGAREEQVYLLCLNARCKVLCCRQIACGSINTVGVSVRKVVEEAIRAGATSVALAHNHVSGIALPSREDEHTTELIRSALAAVDIVLIDHIIVAEGDYVSMAESGLLRAGC